MNAKIEVFISSFLFAVLSLCYTAAAQDADTLKNKINIGVNYLSHGEDCSGGLPSSKTEVVEDYSNYVMGRFRMTVGYERDWLEMRGVIQNSAVWGMAGNMSLGLYEGWVKMKGAWGGFAQIGRVALAYDDERIIGPNDFAMAALSHDVLLLGYEGYGHKLHAILAYNQDADNVYANTYYVNGAKAYKNMQTVWYHYDVPKFPLGASLLFMNVGMQAGVQGDAKNPPHNEYQQLFGGYIKFAPEILTLEGAYYRQCGNDVNATSMHSIPIDAWMDGKEIEPEICTYAQFVTEQKAAESGEAFAESATFFKECLGEVEEVTELAPDLTNPRPQGENGRVWAPIVWDDATRLAKQQGVNPSAVLLSAVFYSLSRFSGSDEVCITTISNGRSNLKVANTMGMFVNTLALYSKIGAQNVQEFIHESADTFEQTLAHENYPFARIAADYGLKADIMFAYQIGVLSDYRVGGEKILPLTPPTAYRMHNGYGPTECTIFTTTYPLTEFEQNAPIGKPLDNLQLFIVDKDLNRLPLGAAGELLVSGPQVSRGYLNLPEKTAETYITWEGKRCYRTGDIVRYLEDGNVQFVGRRDGQVKIRGFRIELKEVEAVIREYPGIKDATVQAFDYPNGGKFIAAYVVCDNKLDIQSLNSFIRERKPPYMVPAATMQLEEIPLNQNQKVNRRALPAPQIQAESREYVAPANEVEKLFCDIFAGILSMDKVGATDNFFELGGTSLMVTKVVIEADKAGKHVAYGDVFSHPSPRLLAQFVSGDALAGEQTDTEVEEFDYSGIDAILQHNNVETFLKGERQQLGNVLLTGATGYLGIHVLRELINSDAKTITCLVRGKDQPSAEHRLKNLLFYYFEKSYADLFGTRLFVVNGDVTEDMTQVLPEGQPAIDTVFNCAASVKHYSKGTDIEDVNIGGARRCVEFCLKTGARLVHISTTSVGEIWVDRGDGKQVPMLDEKKLWFGQFLDNRYMHSKFLAERLVLDAVAHHGLSAKVMRVGNLAPRSSDGEFQANFNSNSYMGRLKIFYTLGCCPYDGFDEYTEMSPIDETSHAVVLLASTPKECTVFQPFNNHTELLGDVLRLMEKVGREMRFVEAAEFQQAIEIAGQDPEKAKLLSAMLAYQDVTHGQKAVIIERDNRYTCSVLHRLGFHWSDTSSEYILQMLRQIAAFGFFG